VGQRQPLRHGEAQVLVVRDYHHQDGEDVMVALVVVQLRVLHHHCVDHLLFMIVGGKAEGEGGGEDVSY
jgi:hypothetical protein